MCFSIDAQSSKTNHFVAVNNMIVKPGTSGNRPDRNNNPGNLRLGGRTDNGRFTIFPTPEAGFVALVNDLNQKFTGNSKSARRVLGRDAKTLLEVISVYAPSSDGNSPTNYASAVASELGVSAHEPVENLLPRLEEVAQAFARHEGFTGEIITNF